MKTTSNYPRRIALIIVTVCLLFLPMFFEFYYLTFYYIAVIILIPIVIFRLIREEKINQRFYKRWHKAREKGFWINVILEGVRSLFIITAVISFSQLVGNGRTPFGIVSELSSSAFTWISLFLIVFSFLNGIVMWYENEKRYYRIQNNNR